MLDSRRVWFGPPAPKVVRATHLESRVGAILVGVDCREEIPRCHFPTACVE